MKSDDIYVPEEFFQEIYYLDNQTIKKFRILIQSINLFRNFRKNKLSKSNLITAKNMCKNIHLVCNKATFN